MLNFLSNPLCKLLNIKYPIIQGGMIWCSGHKLATAVSNAGGLGLIGSGSMRPDLLREHISKAKQNCKNTFGVNIPLFYKYTDDFIDIVIAEKVKVVVLSAGSPKKYIKPLKEAGIITGHVVPSVFLAQKCLDAGVDFIVAEGFEAGGHNGIDEITTLCLIPQVKKIVNIPLVAAGGIATGEQMLASMVLGANGVQIGTLFACTIESSAHQAFKEAIMQATENSTTLTLKKLMPVRLLKNQFYQQIKELEDKGLDTEANLKELLGKGRAKKGIFDGDLVEGELEVSMAAALINNCKSANQVIKDLLEQYQKRLMDIGN